MCFKIYSGMIKLLSADKTMKTSGQGFALCCKWNFPSSVTKIGRSPYLITLQLVLTVLVIYCIPFASRKMCPRSKYLNSLYCLLFKLCVTIFPTIAQNCIVLNMMWGFFQSLFLCDTAWHLFRRFVCNI